MTGDWQWIINTALTVAFSVIGWFARQLWDSVKKLKDDLSELQANLPIIYVRREDLRYQSERSDRFMSESFKDIKDQIIGIGKSIDAKVDKIFDKLDTKADK